MKQIKPPSQNAIGSALDPSSSQAAGPRVNLGMRGAELLEALASDKMSQRAITALWLASQNYVAHGGQFPINRFLGLPRDRAGFKLHTRNIWIRKAAEMLDCKGPFQQAHAVRCEWEKFQMRGPWLQWKALASVPEGTSAMRAALFHICKNSSGTPLTERQIFNILKQ